MFVDLGFMGILFILYLDIVRVIFLFSGMPLMDFVKCVLYGLNPLLLVLFPSRKPYMLSEVT